MESKQLKPICDTGAGQWPASTDEGATVITEEIELPFGVDIYVDGVNVVMGQVGDVVMVWKVCRSIHGTFRSTPARIACRTSPNPWFHRQL